MSDMLPSDPQSQHPVKRNAERSYETVHTVPGDASEIDVRGILQTLRRNLWLVVICTVVAGGLAARYASKVPARYSATSTLRALDERRMLTGGMEVGLADAVGSRQADPIVSQLQIVQSRGILGQVVDRVGLRLVAIEGTLPRSILSVTRISPDATADTLVFNFGEQSFTIAGLPRAVTAAYGQPISEGGLELTVLRRPEPAEVRAVLLDRDEAITALSAALRPRVRERTDLIDIEYISQDPALAQQVVNATAEIFRQYSQDAAREQSRRRRDFVEAQLEETERVLAQAQQRLIDFQRREQVFSSQDRFETQQGTLYQLDLRRAELRAERRGLASLLAQVTRDGGVSREGVRAIVAHPALAESGVVSQLYGQLTQLESVQDSMEAARTATSNPDYVQTARLIENTEQNLVAALRSHIAGIDARIAGLDDLAEQYQSELAGMPALQAEEARLLLDYETIRRSSEQLRQEAQFARIAEAVEVGQVQLVDLAPLPRRPLSQGQVRIVIMGVLAGLLTGAGIGLLREQMNTSVRAQDDVELQLGLPSLVVVPRIHTNGRRRLPPVRANGGRQLPVRADADSSLVTLLDTHSPSAEAFRTLRTNLMFSQTSGVLEKLVVTSSATGEGKSTISANLAISYAQQGMRVLLIDCDLRRPRIHQIFDLPKTPGLTDLVMEHSSLADTLHETDVPGLKVLTAGTQPPNPAELIGGPRLRNALAQLSQEFDIVIYDTPPLLAAAEAAILAGRADGTILVVRAGKTDRESVRHVIGQLNTVGANIVGVVLNDIDAVVPKYSRYGQYYYSYYGSEELQES